MLPPQEQFLFFSTIFHNLILDFCVIRRTRFFLRDKRLFEITEVEITRVDCICKLNSRNSSPPYGASAVKGFVFFSLPEHEVLMVSYCDRFLSVVLASSTFALNDFSSKTVSQILK